MAPARLVSVLASRASLLGRHSWNHSLVSPDGALELRRGAESDASALAHLRFTWRSDEGAERGLDRAAFEVSLRDWIEQHRSSHIPFLAFRGALPIGMTWMALVDRIPGPEHFVRRSAYIQSTYVAQPERARGVGTALVRLLVAHARELHLDYLAVHPSERAFDLYRRLGFAETGRVLELRL
jgi:ribosomal protein S18 acetylase RimI-like enzyme